MNMKMMLKNTGHFLILQSIFIFLSLFTNINKFSFMIFTLFIVIFFIVCEVIQYLYRHDKNFLEISTIVLSSIFSISMFSLYSILAMFLGFSGINLYIIFFLETTIFSTLLYFNIIE